MYNRLYLQFSAIYSDKLMCYTQKDISWLVMTIKLISIIYANYMQIKPNLTLISQNLNSLPQNTSFVTFLAS
jgi:ABC-type xylose transport system permease subunit